jgi:hypothetical protein
MSDPSSRASARKLPSPEEIDAMVVFPPGNPECQVLCQDLQDTVDELEEATDAQRPRLVARLKALNARMRVLHCPLCLLE